MKSRTTWFVVVFLLFQAGGMISYYLIGMPLGIAEVSFIFIVAVLTGLGCAVTGPRFEEAIRQSRDWRREQRREMDND